MLYIIKNNTINQFKKATTDINGDKCFIYINNDDSLTLEFANEIKLNDAFDYIKGCVVSSNNIDCSLIEYMEQ
jgi:vacuolar-type H+-ATPase subunit E/Vma4